MVSFRLSRARPACSRIGKNLTLVVRGSPEDQDVLAEECSFFYGVGDDNKRKLSFLPELEG